MIHWAWIIVAVFAGAFMGIGMMCLWIMVARDERGNGLPGGNENKHRPRNPVDLDAERRVIGLSLTRVK